MTRPVNSGKANVDAVRLKQIQTLFHEAADLPQAEQRTFLQTACGNDDEVLAQVLAMLKEDGQSDSLLDGSVDDLARQVFGEASTSPYVLHEFGPYRLKKLLGEGGMGVVYLAERDDLHSLAAIKILRDGWLSPTRREHFASEQRTLARLNDPSIARLYDADTLGDGTPWFAMEYVEGVPITDYCRNHKCTIEQRLRLFVLYARPSCTRMVRQLFTAT
jgi:hypothetical protein